jgi:hypothetical protein
MDARWSILGTGHELKRSSEALRRHFRKVRIGWSTPIGTFYDTDGNQKFVAAGATAADLPIVRLEFQLGPGTNRLVGTLALELSEIHFNSQPGCIRQAYPAVLLGRVRAIRHLEE